MRSLSKNLLSLLNDQKQWIRTHQLNLLVSAIIILDAFLAAFVWMLNRHTATTLEVVWTTTACLLCALSLGNGFQRWFWPQILVLAVHVIVYTTPFGLIPIGPVYLYALACVYSAINWRGWIVLPVIAQLTACIFLAPVRDYVSFELFLLDLTGFALGLLARSWQSAQNMRVREEKLKRAEQLNRERQNNLAIAVRLHDRVANNLAGIITIAQTQLLAHDHDMKEWETVRSQARLAYGESHSILDLLRDDPHADSVPQPVPSLSSPSDLRYIDRLRTILSEQKQRLTEHGLQGTTAFTVTGSPILTPAARTEAEDLIREFASNIGRHMSTSDTYVLTISLSRSGIRIVTMNNIPAVPISRGGSSGRGLSIHRELVRQLGGTLSFGSDNDDTDCSSSNSKPCSGQTKRTWIAVATIPAQQPSA
jgi:signal transduction histidine kinase